jgi:DNA-binding NarL/FixJ family response regulator
MAEEQKKIKILFIDSDEMMRIYFRDIFWIYGRSDSYEVTIASSFEEAEKKMDDKETRPDTIFLDVMIPTPGKDNSASEKVKRTQDFIARVRKNKDLSSTKIIIFSDQKEEEVKNEVRKYGVDGYLIKGELLPKEIINYTDKFHECNN